MTTLRVRAQAKILFPKGKCGCGKRLQPKTDPLFLSGKCVGKNKGTRPNY
ncbi:MAG: hypothetical protein QM564_08850 [Bergeyella sp.]